MQNTTPTIGQIVIYNLSDQDLYQLKDSSVCNHTRELPAIITNVWGDTCINVNVVLDGQVTKDGRTHLWKTSILKGDSTGEWQWPVKK